MIDEEERNGDDPSLSEARASRLVLRVMWADCVGREFDVLMFILERIYFYNNVEHAIPERHFLQGVIRNGEVWMPPLKMSEATLKRCIKGLRDKGMVYVRPGTVARAPVYRLNERYPEADHEAQSWALRGSPMSPMRLTHEPINIENSKKEKKTNIARASAHEDLENVTNRENVNMAGYTTIEEAIAAATAKTKSARVKKKANGNATAYEKIWEDAFRETYPTEQWFMWTIDLKSRVKVAMNRGSIPDDSREAFITFVVEHYASILGKYFSGWKITDKIPSSSVIPLFVKHIDKFWRAYQDHLDPNRALMHRVRSGGAAKPDVNVSVPAKTADAEQAKLIKQLEAENASLKKTIALKRSSEVAGRRQALRKLVLPKSRAEVERGHGDEFVWKD